MKANDTPVIRTVTVVWHGESVDVPVTYFNAGCEAPIAATPDCNGYDNEGDPGEVEFLTPIMNGVGDQFMEALNLADDDWFVDLVFEAMQS